MMFFTNLDDEGLVIFPTHRVIHSLPKFDWKEFSSTIQKYFELKSCATQQEMMNDLGAHPRYSFGILAGEGSKYWTASLKDTSSLDALVPASLPAEVRDLDVVLLHSYLLGTVLKISVEAQEKKLNIHYIQSIDECENEVTKGVAQGAFIVNPTKIEQVRAVAKGGHTMPQKSTFFYPKLLSGLVLNKMAD
jgi:uncharacterized protein (DUF1015 family)